MLPAFMAAYFSVTHVKVRQIYKRSPPLCACPQLRKSELCKNNSGLSSTLKRLRFSVLFLRDFPLYLNVLVHVVITPPGTGAGATRPGENLRTCLGS